LNKHANFTRNLAEVRGARLLHSKAYRPSVVVDVHQHASNTK